VKIALLGSTGLIGSAIRARLSRDHRVVVVERRKGTETGLSGDLNDLESLRALNLEGCEALIHAAGIVNEDFADAPRAFFQATQGMAALVSRALASGVRRFCYVSSAHVYGAFRGAIDERSPPNPLSDYAIAHFASEQILRRSAKPDFAGLVLRPNAVFGIPPDLARFRRWSLVPFGFPNDAVTKQSIVLQSSGKQHRNFVATDDVAAVVEAWLGSAGSPPFQIVNPIGHSSMTVIDFAKLCAREYESLTGRACTVVAPPAGDEAADDFRYESRCTQPAAKADLPETLRQLTRLLLARNSHEARR
jgi:UDP-glucose 4-epimerase